MYARHTFSRRRPRAKNPITAAEVAHIRISTPRPPIVLIHGEHVDQRVEAGDRVQRSAR